MKIQPYVQKLESSQIYKNFIKKNAESFLVAGFFVLDGEVEVRLLDMMSKEKIPQKLDIKTKIDLDAIKGILEDEMKNRNITESIKKCVAVLQMVDQKKLWVLNCVLSGMEILKAHVDDNS